MDPLKRVLTREVGIQIKSTKGDKIEKNGENHPLQYRCRVSTYKRGNYMHNTMTKGRNWEGKDYCTSFSYLMCLNESISAPIVPLSQIPKPAKSVPHISDV